MKTYHYLSSYLSFWCKTCSAIRVQGIVVGHVQKEPLTITLLEMFQTCTHCTPVAIEPDNRKPTTSGGYSDPTRHGKHDMMLPYFAAILVDVYYTLVI